MVASRGPASYPGRDHGAVRDAFLPSMSGPPPGPIVVLTGAGISAESGLATFRGAGGLWEGHRFEEVATPAAFAADPALVHRFYNARRAQLGAAEVRPNAAHRALARLERAWPGGMLLVTQNVDDLHQRAGSRNLVAMHGQLLKALCVPCGAVSDWPGPLDGASVCPGCGRAGGLRPDIVWFGEMPRELCRIDAALARCELFVAVGTSGAVYPAAGFAARARAGGGRARTIEINLERSAVADSFAEHRHGPAGLLVPALVEELLESVGKD